MDRPSDFFLKKSQKYIFLVKSPTCKILETGFFFFIIVVLGGGTLWHLKKFLQYIICIILDSWGSF
jgi:hypothetical protein